MNNELTNEKIDKIMFRYFDVVFEGAKYAIKDYSNDGKWVGIYKGPNVLVGAPKDKNSQGIWFCDGTVFDGAENILGITTPEVYDSMERYINKKYPKAKFTSIT